MDMRQQLLDCATVLTRLANSMIIETQPRKSRTIPTAWSVSYSQFQRTLYEKYPHNRTGHGAKRAFLDYNHAEYAAGRVKFRITESMEQSWLRDGEVPTWAHDFLQSIPTLPARPPRTRWTPDEVQYLANLMQRFPHETYDQYAVRCSRRFHRPITLNAIKGASDRENIGKRK